jgi:ABC-2 type transport system permease protein
MSFISLALRQARFENKAFWRNPAAAFFTFFFPIMFLVLFNLLFGNDTLKINGGTAKQSTFYVPAIMCFAVISACYTNIAMNVTFARDNGVLKRLRGTPLPPLAYLLGRMAQAVLVALILVVLVIVFGRVFFGVHLRTAAVPGFVITLVLAAAAFCSLGLAITTFIPNAQAAAAIVQASILPLLFVSDTFINMKDSAKWLTTFSSFFPIIHFSKALQEAFNPFESGAAIQPGHLAVIGAWGLAGVVIVIRRFSWEPKR